MQNERHPRNFKVEGQKLKPRNSMFSRKEEKEAMRNGDWSIAVPKAEARKMAFNRKEFNFEYYTPARQQKRLHQNQLAQEAEHDMGEW